MRRRNHTSLHLLGRLGLLVGLYRIPVYSAKDVEISFIAQDGQRHRLDGLVEIEAR